jgi:hypothetical protein
VGLPEQRAGAEGRSRGLEQSYSNTMLRSWTLVAIVALCGGPATVSPAATLLNATLTPSANGVDGFTTYEMSVALGGNASSIYAMYGNADSPMSFPPVFGIKPRAFAGGPGLHTWLTIGRDTPESSLTGVGIDWSAWTNTTGLTSTNALIFVAPDAGPSATNGRPVLLGTMTVRSGSSGAITLGLQGRSAGGTEADDWRLDGVAFSYGGGALRVSSSLTFAAADIAELAGGGGSDGSAAAAARREEFEAAFKAAMAAALDDGSTDGSIGVEAEAITIDSITAGSVVVGFSAEVNTAADARAVSSSLASLATGGGQTTTIVVAGYTADVATLSDPVVRAAPAVPAPAAPAPAVPSAVDGTAVATANTTDTMANTTIAVAANTTTAAMVPPPPPPPAVSVPAADDNGTTTIIITSVAATAPAPAPYNKVPASSAAARAGGGSMAIAVMATTTTLLAAAAC